MRARFGVIGLGLLCGACLTSRRGPSIWPPLDFYVEVRGVVVDDGVRRHQRFQVWADGLAVYREADRAFRSGSLEVPVFHRACAYVLDQRSVRTLGRLLDRARLFDLRDDTDRDRNPSGEHVLVLWRGFERGGSLVTDLQAAGELDRTLHVINSFLPADNAFRYDDLAGEAEPRHVSYVPAPHDDVNGSYRMHRELAQRFPDDLQLRVDLLAVSLDAGHLEFAAAMLRVIESFEPQPLLGDPLEHRDWEGDFLPALRALFE